MAAKKRDIKISEARILIYLEQTPEAVHYVRKISSKLRMDYGYCIKILGDMIEKNWLRRSKSLANPSRTYYYLTQKGKWKATIAPIIAGT